jgi:hypothetical protein
MTNPAHLEVPMPETAIPEHALRPVPLRDAELDPPARRETAPEMRRRDVYPRAPWSTGASSATAPCVLCASASGRC